MKSAFLFATVLVPIGASQRPAQQPGKVAELEALLQQARTDLPDFPLVAKSKDKRKICP